MHALAHNLNVVISKRVRGLNLPIEIQARPRLGFGYTLMISRDQKKIYYYCS